jgi:hypothetical protein
MPFAPLTLCIFVDPACLASIPISIDEFAQSFFTS